MRQPCRSAAGTNRDMAGNDPTVTEVLQEQARALQALIQEAQRIHAEITGQLETLGHAGDRSAPNRKM